jgi:ceramide glucosyltransferase
MISLLTVWALFAAGFSGVALWRLRSQVSTQKAARARWPKVLLLRPVDAPSAGEVANLNQPIAYAGELRHVVVSPFRPRIDLPQVEWLASDPLTANRKVGHLMYALACLRDAGDSLVLSVDADVDVDGALVESLVQGLLDGHSLISAAPQPSRLRSFAGRAVRGLLTQSHHSFRALDVMSVGAKAVCGKALGLSAAACAELGSLHDCLGEDLELASQLQAKGLSVELSGSPANVPLSSALTLRQSQDRFTRWMQVLRAHRPALFPTVPFLFCPTPILMFAATIAADAWLAGGLSVLVGLRIAMAGKLDNRPGWRFEWLLGELLLLASWMSAVMAGPKVMWRGREFRVSSGGRLTMTVAVPNRGESC